MSSLIKIWSFVYMVMFRHIATKPSDRRMLQKSVLVKPSSSFTYPFY